MARFYGKVGFAQENVKIGPGVWDDVIVEYMYSGDVVRTMLRFQEGESVNNDLSVSNSISIVADEFARNHFFAIRYVEWAGALWTINNVEFKSPRLLMRLGSVYNGPKGSAPVSP